MIQKVTGCYKTDYAPHQYFPSNIINLNDDEVFIDCGAYNGDTVHDFLKELTERSIHSYRRILAFEPDKENQCCFKENLNNLPNIELISGGVWNKNDVLRFNNKEGASSSINENGDVEIPVYSIDSVLNGERATMIKMDVEGSELDALRGAQETIKTWHPKLAICCYHKSEDLFTIPQYIKELNPNYRLYIRKHSPAALELVIYAV